MKRFLIGIFSLITGFSLAQKKWSLKECIDYAMEYNLKVISNTYNQQMQDKDLEIAKKQRMPSFTGSFGNNTSFGQQQFGSAIQRNDSYSNNMNISGDILLYNNRRLEKNIRKTEFEVEAAKYDVETVKNNLSLQITQEYLSILLNKELVNISKSALENAQKSYDRARVTTEVGTTPRTTLAEAEAALAREKQSLKSAEINVNRSLFALAQLLQLKDYKAFEIADTPEDIEVVAPLLSSENVLSIAYQQQPQIKAAETRIKAAEMQTEVSKSAFFPTVSASVGLGTFYLDNLNRADEVGYIQQYKDNFSQQLGFTASIPIFNKGITKVQVEQSKLNEEIAKNNLLQQKQEIKENVQKALFDAENNYENYLSAIEAEKSSALALDFAEKSFNAGRTTIYDLNIARNNYVNAKGTVAQAKFNYIFSLKLLNFYSGIPISL